jgi:hypothetical protein
MDIEIKRQISVAIENQPGRLGQIGRLLAQRGIDINAFSVIDNVEQAMVRLVTEEPAAAGPAEDKAAAPKKKKAVEEVPVTISGETINLLEYGQLTDPTADGHCGFRAIAQILTDYQSSYADVRKSGAAEFEQHRQLYISMFGWEGFSDCGKKCSKFVKDLLAENAKKTVDERFWLDLSTHGILYANCYKRPIVLYDIDEENNSWTYVPTVGTVESDVPIYLVFTIKDEYGHYLALILNDENELPPFPPLPPNYDPQVDHFKNAVDYAKKRGIPSSF